MHDHAAQPGSFSMLNSCCWRSVLELSPANTSCRFLLSFASNCAIKTLQSWLVKRLDEELLFYSLGGYCKKREFPSPLPRGSGMQRLCSFTGTCGNLPFSRAGARPGTERVCFMRWQTHPCGEPPCGIFSRQSLQLLGGGDCCQYQHQSCSPGGTKEAGQCVHSPYPR